MCFRMTNCENHDHIAMEHTGKCIRRFGGIYVYCRYLRPEVVDIGVNTI